MIDKIELVHIVAYDINGCIGNNGELPWHLPADLKRFKELTSGGVVVMGRKTFESLNCKPLPNRVNIVITNDFQLKVDHASSKVIFYSSISAAIEKAKYEAMVLGLKEVWIIGGQSIYEQTMPYVDSIELTCVIGKYSGDTYYPTLPAITVTNKTGILTDPTTKIKYEHLTFKVTKEMADKQEECSGSSSPDFIKISIPKGTVNLTRDNTKVKLPSVASISCMRCKKAYPINSIEYMCFTDGNCQKCRAELSGKFCTGQGRKHDSNKPRYSLLPSGTVNQVIQVLEYGAVKYEPDNWKHVPDARTRYYDAAMRHIDDWWNGSEVDEESSLPHLAHAICCLLFLLWFDEQE